MQDIQINFTDQNDHVLIGQRIGDWIIFTCPKCPGFQKWYNWKTREKKTIGEPLSNLHTGSFMPVKGVEGSKN